MSKYYNNFIDLTGRKFGRLTVIKFSHINKHGRSMWLCQCSCGGPSSLKVINGFSLKNGDTKSCGCIQKETISKIGKRTGKINGGNNKLSLKQVKLRSKKLGFIFLGKKYINNGFKHIFLCLKHGKAYKSNFGSLQQGHGLKCCGTEKLKNNFGKNNHNFNPNITNKQREDRNYILNYENWSKHIKQKGFCQICGTTEKLHAHHVNEGFSERNKKEQISLDNGICLCENCHNVFHEEYGRIDFTFDDYLEFKKDWSIFP